MGFSCLLEDLPKIVSRILLWTNKYNGYHDWKVAASDFFLARHTPPLVEIEDASLGEVLELATKLDTLRWIYDHAGLAFPVDHTDYFVGLISQLEDILSDFDFLADINHQEVEPGLLADILERIPSNLEDSVYNSQLKSNMLKLQEVWRGSSGIHFF